MPAATYSDPVNWNVYQIAHGSRDCITYMSKSNEN